MADTDDNSQEQLSPAQTDTRDQILTDLEAVIQTPEGKRITLWFLSLCGIYEAQFTGDDAATNFKLGQREVGLRVIQKMNALSPTTYPRLMLSQAQVADLNKATVHVLDAD